MTEPFDLTIASLRRQIQPQFYSIINFIDEDKLLDLNNEEQMEQFNKLDEKTRRINYRGFWVKQSGKFTINGRDVNYYALGLPSRLTFKNLSDQYGLFTTYNNRLINPRYVKRKGKQDGFKWYNKNQAFVVKLDANISVGDRVDVSSPDAHFYTEIESIYIENEKVEFANAGTLAGIKLNSEFKVKRSTKIVLHPEVSKEYLLRPGIFVASKNMPTAITLTPPQTGGAGYWQNLYIIIEDDAIIFDEGRKTITKAKPKILAERCKPIFNKIALNYIQKYTSFDHKDVEDTRAIDREIMNQRFKSYRDGKPLIIHSSIEAKPALRYYDVNNQEAPVQSIFNQLIGAGYIENMFVGTEGYKRQYDCDLIYFPEYTKSSHKKLVNLAQTSGLKIGQKVFIPTIGEYKARGEELVKDLRDGGPKYVEDIDLLICWNIEENPKAKSWNDEIEYITKIGDPGSTFYKVTTHRVRFFSVNRTMSVLSLSHYINWLNQQKATKQSDQTLTFDGNSEDKAELNNSVDDFDDFDESIFEF